MRRGVILLRIAGDQRIDKASLTLYHLYMMKQTVEMISIGTIRREDAAAGKSIEALRAERVRIEIDPELTDGLLGLAAGSDVLVLYHFDRRQTDYTLQVHPRGNPSRPLRGVFATRSPARPNPIAATSARVLSRAGNVLEVVGLDALDETPVLDIKPLSDFEAPYRGRAGER